MDVTPLIRSGQQIIQSYSGGRFRVSGAVYEGALIVMPEGSQRWDFAGEVADLSEPDFVPLIEQAAEIDVVLLGCGATIQFLSSNLKNALKACGLNVEVMDSGAACRTYNVLMADGRRVAAALLPF
ncbi:MAG TPA: Mth938-like domain-containing protein [Alphaproteobacteria bacterium]|nr:Mth938-like domain-containing protein [Alphaproteobacteria bacterium]USO05970.1 MAG: Mth938-like domain-containing protein [Rhodospirillales bacterium]HOO81171.1 Mth938-like domain-containing protein [Alphaproteobacteria bacterium]